MNDGDLTDWRPDRGEEVRWRGASSRWAHLPNQVPGIAITAAFALIASGRDIAGLAAGRLPGGGWVSWLLLGISILATVTLARAIHDETDVRYAVTDRRVVRITRRSTTGMDLASVASAEVTRRAGGRGDILLEPFRPEREGLVMERRVSMRLLDIDDVEGAYAAMRRAGAGTTNMQRLEG